MGSGRCPGPFLFPSKELPVSKSKRVFLSMSESGRWGVGPSQADALLNMLGTCDSAKERRSGFWILRFPRGCTGAVVQSDGVVTAWGKFSGEPTVVHDARTPRAQMMVPIVVRPESKKWLPDMIIPTTNH